MSPSSALTQVVHEMICCFPFTKIIDVLTEGSLNFSFGLGKGQKQRDDTGFQTYFEEGDCFVKQPTWERREAAVHHVGRTEGGSLPFDESLLHNCQPRAFLW